MEYLSSDRIAVVDLASGEVSEDELSEELVQEKIGGAGITSALYRQYEDEDPVVLGAGLLTGTSVPGSCLGIMTAKSPLTGQLCHVPLTQYAGMEIKYSGFDYLVLKGRAAEPVFLWVHDGIADIENAGGLWGMDVWAAVDKVRQDMGDELIQVLGAGPAAEKGSDLGQVMINQWASGDRFGLGKVLAQKKIKLIALRGMGLLEIDDPEGFVAQANALLGEVKAGPWAGKKGMGDLAAGLGEADLAAWLEPLVHRHHADFNTPFAANTFVFLEGDPSQLTEPQQPEPGLLLTDVYAPLAFMKMGLGAAEACGIIKECLKLGLDAAGVAQICASLGQSDAGAIMASLGEITGPVTGLSGVFSPWAPDKPVFADFGPVDDAWRQRRQAVAYIFGISPLFAMMSPELSEAKLLTLANLGTGMEFSAETLEQVVGAITG